jgi:nitrite reductase (NO-forming)
MSQVTPDRPSHRPITDEELEALLAAADETTSRSAILKVGLVLLGLLVAAMAIIGLFVLAAARDASSDAKRAAQAPTAMAPAAATGGAFHSFAGAAPMNADQLAMAHTPYNATLPPAPAGPVANVHLVIKDTVQQIAPGVRYRVWTFGDTAPGPIVHVRQGQLVHVTLVNQGSMPHSVDFHAARIAPNTAFTDVMPGKSFSFTFRANDPGVFMYHCGTKPVLMHIANGMYGAIVVEPPNLPPVQHQYVLVSSEWYLNKDDLKAPADLDYDKALAGIPDWVTWNGYASQYATHPLLASPGDTTRFWVVAAGPTLSTEFHVVGTILNRAWANADMTSPPERNVQTVHVPAGGGGVFDVKVDDPGTYAFVSHAFATVAKGQVGLLKVGNPATTMSH